MVERSLCMWVVRELITRISKRKYLICYYIFSFSQLSMPRITKPKYLLIFWYFFIFTIIDDGTFKVLWCKNQGDIAQMVERSLCMWEVQGSIPCISKNNKTIYYISFQFFLIHDMLGNNISSFSLLLMTGSLEFFYVKCKIVGL